MAKGSQPHPAQKQPLALYSPTLIINSSPRTLSLSGVGPILPVQPFLPRFLCPRPSLLLSHLHPWRMSVCVSSFKACHLQSLAQLQSSLLHKTCLISYWHSCHFLHLSGGFHVVSITQASKVVLLLPHFTDWGNEVRRDEATYSKSHSQC